MLAELSSGNVGPVVAGPWRIAAFELTGKVGASAVGEIHCADHRETGRRSYLRILAPAYTSDEEAIRLAIASVHDAPPIVHQNIGGGCMYTADFAAGRVEDRVYLVFSSAQKLDLETLVGGGPLPWSEVRWMMLDVCRGLDAAHRRHYFHGDLRPGHCFLLEFDGDPEDVHRRVRVTGFGLGKARARGPDTASLAPELRTGADADARSDVWGTASTLLHLLLGRAAPGDAYRDDGVRQEPPAWPREVDAILATALASDPNDRYPTVRALAAALAAVGGGDVEAVMARFEPLRSPMRKQAGPPKWAMVALGVSGAGLLLALVLWLGF